MVYVDEHHDPDLGRHARQRDESHGRGDRHVVAEHVHQPESADESEWQSRHDEQGLRDAPEREIEQDEDDRERPRHHNLQPRSRALEELELPGPGDRGAGRKLHLLRHRALHVAHRGTEIAPADVDVHPARKPRVLGFQHRRAIRDFHLGHITETDLRTAFGQERQFADLFHRVAHLARIAHVDGEALQALHGLTDVVAADRRGDDAVDVGDVQPVARRGVAVDIDVDVASAAQTLGERGAHARHLLHDALDLGGDTIDLAQIRTRDLHTHRAFDAGREHIDAVADGRHPYVREPGHFHDAIELIDEFFRGHSRPPLLPRLQLDRGLEHLERRRVGRRLRAPGLAEHARDFGHGLDKPVGLLQQLGRLARRKTGQRRRHVKQIAFVERRHELAPEPVHGPERRGEDRNGDE